MNNIMMGLLYIEEQAGQGDLAAEEERAALPRRIEEARRKIEEGADRHAEKRIQEMKKKIADETEKRIAEIEATTRERKKYIERRFAEDGKAWENEIFEAITGN